MKKKGFTLVELLAVIAILAILVIIALPNVLEMYKQARKNSFENEVKEVFRQAQQQYLLDSMGMDGGDAKVYSNQEGKDAELDLQGGNGTFEYCVIVNSSGVVTSMRVSNGTYAYTLTDGSTLEDAANISVPETTDTKGTSISGSGANRKCAQAS